MFNNYLKIALRNLLKQKVYSGINIVGLAVGMACCLLILAFMIMKTRQVSETCRVSFFGSSASLTPY